MCYSLQAFHKSSKCCFSNLRLIYRKSLQVSRTVLRISANLIVFSSGFCHSRVKMNNLDKYLDLGQGFKNLRNMTVTVMTIVLGALDIITKNGQVHIR